MGEDTDILEVFTTPDDFAEVKDNLEQLDVRFDTAEVALIPENTVEISDSETARKVLQLMDVLEDHDDVQEVYSTFLFQMRL